MDNKTNRIINLYNNKSDCCGCGACMNICPKQAISMQPDEYGFIYPKIDEGICISCGLCKKVCGYQTEVTAPEINDTYVAVAKDSEMLRNSASGGVFAALATEVINRGGVAFGCSMEQGNGKLIPQHIMVNDLKDLIKLQGSKYVQSYLGNTYMQAKSELDYGRLVLFSGTPCQIDGLKHYLMKDYGNLITLDLICHGLPSAQMFQDYISELEKKLKGQIIDYKFRDKSKGWTSYESRIKLIIHNKTINKSLTNNFYNSLFLSSMISRENCYSCKYANSNRVGDLTIGDFWGIENEHPQYLKSIDIRKGVSCVIVNNHHGANMLRDLCKNIELFPSKFDNAARVNNQLNHPSIRSEKREEVLDIYKDKGYAAVSKWYKNSQGVKYYKNLVKGLLPDKLKSTLKRLLNK
ncbi:MAG: Coenzyme F420 hydrogenase/dehydrogenase, beta subunit C-terminal domain [Erysipelotrichaceae bacterium]